MAETPLRQETTNNDGGINNTTIKTMIKQFITATIAAASLTVPALADPEVRGWQTLDSMGCMMMRECQDDVIRINSVDDLQAAFPDVDYSYVEEEANGLITELAKMGVGVYLGDSKYFPIANAGVYYTVGNDFFLSSRYASSQMRMIRTLRHEAWHAAQDAMAGTIENNNIAIIYPEESVPQQFVLAADIAYGGNPGVLPWEREAKWAGSTPNMTLDVLKIINETNNKPWEQITPTPMTLEWLERNGFVS